jgi:erythronate-4-phosphate dehydrogenase
MRVIVDKNIPCAGEVFRHLGEVQELRTTEITRNAVREAEMLIIRSETAVSKNLLDGSAVRFVGSATAGTDHVDLKYLQETSREFASAPGGNANSVAEYVVAALMSLSVKRNKPLRGMSIGVVGVGNVGSKVVRAAAALGMTVLQNDPPLARATGSPHFLPLEALLECDIVTFHVPLTREGPDPTFHLLSQERCAALKPGAVIINTSRGSVVDEAALKQALGSGRCSGAVLDVWENEPVIDVRLLEMADIGTPHIAGYSYDGKINAVKMVYDAACRWSGKQPQWSPATVHLQQFYPIVNVERQEGSVERTIGQTIQRWYDIEQDDRRLRRISTFPDSGQKMYFRQLRTEYGIRREFFNGEVHCADAEIREALAQIGFQAR